MLCPVPPSLRALACGLLLATVPHLARAQGVGIGTTAPDASAALDIVSSSKGLLLPRVAAATALAAPATGLLVFQTGAPAGFYYNAGTPAVPAWQLLNVVGGPGDNLGNHTATQALNLQGQALTGTGASIGAAVGVGVRADGGLNIGQNTIGNNVLLGFEAGQAITTGGNNVFSGYQSGYANTTGSNNLFSGTNSGVANTTGFQNLFGGTNSGYANTTGSNNVFLGNNTGTANTTGSNNTVLGVNSGPAGGTGALTNATALGANVTLTRSNTVVLGNGANVGIGTNIPDRPLTVQAAPGSVELLSLRDNTGAPSWHWNLAGGGLNLAQSGVADNRIYVSAAGNVGLGTAVPSAVLDVNGAARLRGLTTAGVVTTDAAGNLGSSPAAAAFGGSFVQNTTSPQAASNFNVSGSGTVGGTLTAASAVVTGALTGSGADLGATVGVGVRADGGLNLGQNGVGNNLLLGYQAGQALAPNVAALQGLDNQFVGYQAGQANTTGRNNYFSGNRSGFSNTTGNFNQFIGYQSGNFNTTGGFNLFIGFQSGYNATASTTNQFVGYQSGYSNTTGTNNVFSGYHSGFSSTTGDKNTFTGTESGFFNATGYENTFYGYGSGSSNTTGSLNTFVGSQAGSANTTGLRNLFTGYQSGFLNTTGSSNHFVGYLSGYVNTTGSNNQFNGYQSGYLNTTGSFNQFSGYRSGISNTTASNNQFSGFQAGFANTTGHSNLFVGTGAGYSNVTGSYNQFVGDSSGVNNTASFNQLGGYQSGYSTTTGNLNLFSGYRSGYSNTVGSRNVFVGHQSGFDNTTGNNNVFSGYQSGTNNVNGTVNVFSGYQSGLNNTSGIGNVFVGGLSGANNTTGSSITALGFQSGPAVGSGNLLNATALGYNVALTHNNTVILGNGAFVGIGTSAPAVPLDVATSSVFTSATYTFYANGSTGTNTTDATSIRASGAVLASQFNALSDARLKTVVGRSDNATDLALLNKLRITDYTMRDRVQYGGQRFKKVIAQEVEAVYPQAVSQRRGFVPDLYQLTRLTAQPGDSLLALPLPVPAGGVARGQRLKLLLPTGQEVVVLVARAAPAGVAGLLLRRAAGLATGEVFAFGLEHDDVRAVDYEALSMLNVSATQQLAAQVRELQSQNAALKAQGTAAAGRISTLEARAACAEAQATATTADLLRRLQALEAQGQQAQR